MFVIKLRQTPLYYVSYVEENDEIIYSTSKASALTFETLEEVELTVKTAGITDYTVDIFNQLCNNNLQEVIDKVIVLRCVTCYNNSPP